MGDKSVVWTQGSRKAFIADRRVNQIKESFGVDEKAEISFLTPPLLSSKHFDLIAKKT